jgi:phosphate acetyltransferase
MLGSDHLEAGAIRTVVGGMQFEHMLKGLMAGDLLLIPLDRIDLLAGLLLWDRSEQSVRIAGIVLIGDPEWESPVERLPWLAEIRPSFSILRFSGDIESAQRKLSLLRPGLYPEQTFRIQMAIDHFNRYVDLQVLQARLGALPKRGLSTNLFLYQLVQRAKSKLQHIVLPEGEEPRIQAAARLLIERKLVKLTLLGRVDVMAANLKALGLTLDPEWISLIDPSQSEWLEPFSERYTALRAHKGMTLVAARDRMLDVSYFGTMMVHEGIANGMVSGSVHTTQHTILPAFQFIKTQPGFSIVSSVFFMCLADGVVVYGDCAVNPCPTAEELAQIAVSSADTARAFGVEPNVALLSYSSGQSGVGEEVERVREAVRLAQALRPELNLDGPIQYDAAVDPEVAQLKMPKSKVAGHANVLVFPDLNTGNNTYKAVQRETGAIAIGPILQGLRKPVNDLSRGCTVEDIFHTVIMTAIQAQESESRS